MADTNTTTPPEKGMPAGYVSGSDFYGGYTIVDVEYYESGKQVGQVKGVWADDNKGRPESVKFYFRNKEGKYVRKDNDGKYPSGTAKGRFYLSFPDASPTYYDPSF